MPQGPSAFGSLAWLLGISVGEERQALLELRQKPRWQAAFAVAVVLVLQTFAVAWTSGAMAAGPQLDAFGNTLCITSTDHDGAVPSSDHVKALGCCTFACGAAIAAVAAPPEHGVILRRDLAASDIAFSDERVARAHAPDHNPQSPRAPPLIA